VAWWWEDVIENYAFPVQTRQQAREEQGHRGGRGKCAEGAAPSVPEARDSREDTETRDDEADPLQSVEEAILPTNTWTYPTGVRERAIIPDKDWNHRAHLLVAIDPSVMAEFAEGYTLDPYFKERYIEEIPHPDKVLTPSRFQRGSNRLLYFVDADWSTCLCVPRGKVPFILHWIHESPHESAHAGPLKFLARLKELFFWPSMRRNAHSFAETCDVCQKIKTDHRCKMGGLRPAHVPACPFAMVSMDLITGLPASGKEKFTAVLVFICKLTKYTVMVPTHSELSQEGFAKFFLDHVVNVYGMPERIISDRDTRWLTAFWRSIVLMYGSHMALSSAHHPQTDGQTEILNANIEQMLHAYVAADRSSWARWLGEINHAYNSNVHVSTGYSPDFLLMGYQPQGAAGLLVPSGDPVARPFLPSQKGELFIEALESHRQAARDAVILAQEQQAKAYNKGRRPVEEIKEGDYALVNPHMLELVDVKGTGRKLIQRTIGPFEVMEKINPMVYRLRLPDNYPMHPVFNLQQLRKYHSPDPEFGERTQLPSTRDYLNALEEYVIEAILGHAIKPRKMGINEYSLSVGKDMTPRKTHGCQRMTCATCPP
jgi:hypothetical protein